MKQKVSLILIISDADKNLHNSFASLDFSIKKRTKEFLEDIDTIRRSIGHIEVELLIANRNTATLKKGIFDIYHPLATHYIGSAGNDDIKTYIELIKKASGEYICIIEPTYLFDENWLAQLIDYYEYVNQSGVIAITHQPEAHGLSVLLNAIDGYSHVLIPESNIVKDIYFFKKSYLEFFPITYRPDMLDTICIDASKIGLNNYYITTSFLIKI